MSDWIDKTDEEIRSEAKAEGAQISGLTTGPSVGLEATIWETVALLIQRVYATAIRPFAAAADPRGATGNFLRIHGVLAGVVPRSATSAEGWAQVTVPSQVTMEAGAVIVVAGQQYAVRTDTVVPAEQPTVVPIRAVEGGTAGNVSPGPGEWPDNVDAAVELTASWLVAPGFDADDSDDDLFRRRVLAGLQVRGEDQTIARLTAAAYSAAGVTDVSVQPVPRGPGSVDIGFMIDEQVPTQAQVDAVRPTVEAQGVAGRDIRMRPPTVVRQAVTITVGAPDTASGVAASLDTWWRRNVRLGGAVEESQIIAGLISAGHDVVDVDIALSPAQALVYYAPVPQVEIV